MSHASSDLLAKAASSKQVSLSSRSSKTSSMLAGAAAAVGAAEAAAAAAASMKAIAKSQLNPYTYSYRCTVTTLSNKNGHKMK